MRIALPLILLLVIPLHTAVGADDSVRDLHAPRTSVQPVIDGRLDDDAWSRAEVYDLRDEATEEAAPLETTVRLLWDDDYLYIGLYGEDPDAWTRFEQDDEYLWENEVFESFIDPSGEGHTYYELNLSPAGHLVDLFITNSGPVRRDGIVFLIEWDCLGLKRGVHVDGDPAPGTRDRSWSVELAVPFDRLWTAPKLRPEPGDVWRVNFFRIERGDPDTQADDWQACASPTRGDGFHAPWRFGRLIFD